VPSSDAFAVIVCTRDRPHLLVGALRSILDTTPRDVRIIVVDSASTGEETREVARAAGVDYVRAPVKGLSIARNRGLEAAAGRAYVVYTDDDCRPRPGWTDAIREHFDDPRVGAVTGRMLHHDAATSAPYARKWRMSRVVDGLDGGHGALMAFDRALLARLGGFDDVLGAGRHFAGAEDLDMFCRVLDAGHEVVHTADSVVTHVNTREGEDHTRLHYGYGLGLGALVAKWLRLRTRTGIRMFAVLSKRTIGRILREPASSRAGRADRALYRGMLRGLLVARTLRLDGERFVDAAAPVTDVAGPDPDVAGPGQRRVLNT
jgi:glycosyltransferase involved in cell wall biosynthesis